MNGWSPPDDGAYKTNCRVVVDSNSGHVGTGIIVRNSARDVLACYSKMLEVNLNIDVMNAETRGMSFSHISSLANKAALSLTKNELIIIEDRFWMEEYPGCIRRIVEAKKPG
ncbi:hypothetical protein Q3G72_006831 [Acer saccharum]|nr:hypothetical protein Q3G72_006831 [Acer saccharum]